MDSNEVVVSAEARLIEGTNGHAVLLLHGYTGYPGELMPLATALQDEGYTVSVPRHPGHGTCGDDFLTTDWKDWLSGAEAEYRALEERHESVTVAGLSMGGLLSVILAARFKPRRVILLAPALKVNGAILPFTPILRYIVPRRLPKSRPWAPEPHDGDDVRRLGAEYWTHHYVPNLASLQTLIHLARRSLKQVRCPVLAFFSEADGTVPLSAADLLERRLQAPGKTMILKTSPHVLLQGEENAVIFRESLQWLSEEGSS